MNRDVTVTRNLIYLRKDGQIKIAEKEEVLRYAVEGEQMSSLPFETVLLSDLIETLSNENPIDVFRFKHKLNLSRFDKEMWNSKDVDYNGLEVYWGGSYFADMSALCTYLETPKFAVDECFGSVRLYASPCERRCFNVDLSELIEAWNIEDKPLIEDKPIYGIDEVEKALREFELKNQHIWKVYRQHGKRVKIDYNWKAE
jgi:hypothetical protein